MKTQNHTMTKRNVFLVLIGSLLLATSLACSLGASGPTPSPTPTPTPTPISKPTPGEWIATTDFGKLVFTVDATGSKITKMSYQFSNWTCGPTTNSGTIEVSSEWPISDGEFSIKETLDPGGNQTMTFGGAYSATNQKFSGTWNEISYSSKCSGTWEATAPK